MPCYPALALLLGSAMAASGEWVRRGTRALAVIAACAALAAFAIYGSGAQSPGTRGYFGRVSQHPSAYTFSLGHMQDLTLPSFAYLRTPLADCRDRVSGRSDRHSSSEGPARFSGRRRA